MNAISINKYYCIKTFALSCISTGLSGYPNREAAEVALKTVRKWLPRDRLRRCYKHTSLPRSESFAEDSRCETEHETMSSSSEDENGPQINDAVHPEVDEPGEVATERYNFRPRPTRVPDRLASSQITFL